MTKAEVIALLRYKASVYNASFAGYLASALTGADLRVDARLAAISGDST